MGSQPFFEVTSYFSDADKVKACQSALTALSELIQRDPAEELTLSDYATEGIATILISVEQTLNQVRTHEPEKPGVTAGANGVS